LVNKDRGGGERRSTMGIGKVKLRRNQIRERGKDWFEPVLNVRTSLFPTVTPFVHIPLFSSVIKRKCFYLSIYLSVCLSVCLSGFLTAVAVFRKPNAIPLCFSTDLVLNFCCHGCLYSFHPRLGRPLFLLSRGIQENYSKV